MKNGLLAQKKSTESYLKKDKIFRVLVIAGFDPTAGGGILRDKFVFDYFRIYSVFVPTALTIQTTSGVFVVKKIEENFFKKNLEYIIKDIKPDGVKIGILPSFEQIKILKSFLKEIGEIKIVIDPISFSKNKFQLSVGALEIFKNFKNFKNVILTPNNEEWKEITQEEQQNEKQILNFLKKVKFKGKGIIIKSFKKNSQYIYDVFVNFEKKEIYYYKRRLNKKFKITRGTGCLFSSAFLSLWIKNENLKDSFKKANIFLNKMVKKAKKIGKGNYLI